MMPLSKRTFLIASMACVLPLAANAAEPAKAPEKPNVTIAIGGTFGQVYFLPVVLAQSLGYFKEEGLTPNFVVAGSGAKALQGLISGGADVGALSFEHVLEMRAQGQDIVGLAKFGRFPGNVLAVLNKRVPDFKSIKDLKGWKIGVTSPGSSSQTFANLLLSKVGLTKEDAAFIAIGLGPGAVAAVRTNQVDAISLLEPVISQLTKDNLIKIIVDGRTEAGNTAAYGAETISGCLMVHGKFLKESPHTAQALANAMVKTLRWIKTASVEQIVAKVPAEYFGQSRELYTEMVKQNMASYMHDGSFPAVAIQTVYKYMSEADPRVRDAKLDLTKTADNSFIMAAQKKK